MVESGGAGGAGVGPSKRRPVAVPVQVAQELDVPVLGRPAELNAPATAHRVTQAHIALNGNGATWSASSMQTGGLVAVQT